VPKALAVFLGAEAARRIARDGWQPEQFELLVGASGGAKWLILGHLDRVLFGDYLSRSDRPLDILGSSIGSWRHACLAQPDPVAAIQRLEDAYLRQRYSSTPDTAEISESSRGMLAQMLGEDGGEHIVTHPRIRSHIVTARGRGPAGASSTAILATALASAALGNGLSRRLLRLHFQRVIFQSGLRAEAGLQLQDFQTQRVALSDANVREALHASGSIPFVLTGERDIPGAPPGQYWDGGIIDYHFDLRPYSGEGLLLYPHFSERIVPGWFDKFLPWRATSPARFEKLVLLCPTREFIADLPRGKIPDRSDFKTMPHDERVRYWETCIERSRALAEEFSALLAQRDPLAGALVFS